MCSSFGLQPLLGKLMRSRLMRWPQALPKASPWLHCLAHCCHHIRVVMAKKRPVEAVFEENYHGISRTEPGQPASPTWGPKVCLKRTGRHGMGRCGVVARALVLEGGDEASCLRRQHREAQKQDQAKHHNPRWRGSRVVVHAPSVARPARSSARDECGRTIPGRGQGTEWWRGRRAARRATATSPAAHK